MTQHILNAFYPNYYRWNYFPEFGHMNRSQVIEHFLQSGIQQPRSGSPFFDVVQYLQYNPGLEAQFAASGATNKCEWAYRHWESVGAEAGLMGSTLFQAKYYLDSYPDLRHNGVTMLTASNHWINSGIPEGRTKFSQFCTPHDERVLEILRSHQGVELCSLTARAVCNLDPSPPDAPPPDQSGGAPDILNILIIVKEVIEFIKANPEVWDDIRGFLHTPIGWASVAVKI